MKTTCFINFIILFQTFVPTLCADGLVYSLESNQKTANSNESAEDRQILSIFRPLRILMTLGTIVRGVLRLMTSAGVNLVQRFRPIASFPLSLKSEFMARAGNTSVSWDYLTTLPNEIFDNANISLECRFRGICESARFINGRSTLLTEWAKKISGALFLNLANPYSRAWLNGMNFKSCELAYPECPTSPFKQIIMSSIFGEELHR